MSIVDVNVFADITSALAGAVDGDIVNLRIQNDIIFTSAVMVSRNEITVNVINASSQPFASLLIAEGGSFRHFSALIPSFEGITITANGIALRGGGTGGGISLYGPGCALAMTHCQIVECVSSNGGGIFIQGSQTRGHLRMSETDILQCRASVTGGGIFGSGCDMELNSCNITDNSAAQGGGAIQTIAGPFTLGCSLRMTHVHITRNTTGPSGDGGGLNLFDALVTMEACEVSSNAADNFGGGISAFNQAGQLALNALIIRDCTISQNTIRNFGAGIATRNPLSEFTVYHSAITLNQAQSGQPGSMQGGGIYMVEGAVTLIDSVISENLAGTSGGGIFSNISSVILRGDTEIRDNEALLTGGGVYGYSGASIMVENGAKVLRNHAYCGDDPESTTRGGGGIALLSYGHVSTLTVMPGTEITDNTSVSYGGGIWTYPIYGPETVVDIRGGMIGRNTANYGGGISMGAIPEYTPTLAITGGAIAYNTAFVDGGGIMAMGSSVTAENCEIVGNAAGRNGGGIYTDALEHVTVFPSVVFSGNHAQTYTFWQITSGGDSEIHQTRIFTDHFSPFLPEQTPPPVSWLFTNAYNNYDINYAMPLQTVSVQYIEGDNPDSVIRTTILRSFPSATIVIPARSATTDSEGTVWLPLPDQPPQIIELTDPLGAYVAIFSFAEAPETILVDERYEDELGAEIMPPTQSILTIGSDYTQAAPLIAGYAFVGFRVDDGPLQYGSVHIPAIRANTLVTFVYQRNAAPCVACCCRCLPCQPCLRRTDPSSRIC